MVDVEFISQLIGSMNEAVLNLEKAVAEKNFTNANKLRTFIFDLHRQVESTIRKENV